MSAALTPQQCAKIQAAADKFWACVSTTNIFWDRDAFNRAIAEDIRGSRRLQPAKRPKAKRSGKAVRKPKSRRSTR